MPAMNTIHTYRLYGASDDTLCMTSDDGPNQEWTAQQVGENPHSVGVDGGRLIAAAVIGSFFVTFRYEYEGCWSVYPSLIGEGHGFPAGVSLAYADASNDYSTMLIVQSENPIAFVQADI